MTETSQFHFWIKEAIYLIKIIISRKFYPSNNQPKSEKTVKR